MININSSGIYKILNKTNGKFYLGSAVNFRKRWQLHKNQLRNNKHDNRYLQASWNKYGEVNFIFEILEFCAKDVLLIREQNLIDWMHPEYNICKLVANSRLGVKSSPEHIAKIIKANTGVPKSKEQKDKLRLARLGSKLTEEQKQARRDYRHSDEAKLKISNRKGWNHSDEAKEKMSLAKKGVKRRIPVSDETKLKLKIAALCQWNLKAEIKLMRIGF